MAPSHVDINIFYMHHFMSTSCGLNLKKYGALFAVDLYRLLLKLNTLLYTAFGSA